MVLDPFGGTFTTAAIAKRLGRHYLSWDMDEKYVKYGKRRVDGETYIPDDISTAKFDVKPMKVKMEDMIADGYFHTGERFLMKDKDTAGITLKSNGKLDWNGNEINIHVAAARVRGVKANRLNGFDCWYVERDGKLVSIDDIRNEYRRDKARLAD